MPDFSLPLPPDAVVDPHGFWAERTGLPDDDNVDAARFIHTPDGWTFRDHVLIEWQQLGSTSHRRVSERDLQLSVTVSEQPDQAGVPRLTVDLHASLMRYERDAVVQRAQDGQPCDLGKGWARATLQWSLRLQFVATAGGRANVVCHARRPPPVTDAGRTGAYIVSDPLTHLLNMPRLTHAWEHGDAGLPAVRDGLVSRLAAAIEPMLDDPYEHV
ncbi:hypothetical protein [Pseudoduganella lurida]|uniref:hypothetical protein n=1 Tax=Pseudoduganella lurida TaxID=1036180 RepID=UPI00119DBD3A|nr:hypothetical protein [Pseudoduganella lurida]